MISLEIVLNRIIRILELKENLKPINTLIIMILLIPIMILFSININLISYGDVLLCLDTLKVMCINVCIAIIISVATMINRLILNKRTNREKREKLSKFDIMIAIVFIFITVFDIYLMKLVIFEILNPITVPEKLKSSIKYNVELQYDEDGYVNKIIITEIENNGINNIVINNNIEFIMEDDDL